MTIRRLNYTGRKRINRADIAITLHEKAGEPAVFDADLSKLPNYKLPEDALVFVEAQIQTRWMRFPFGTVGTLTPALDRRLVEFDSTEGVQFTVKVASASGRQGMMLAEADRIPVRFTGESEERRSPLLPVKSEDIGHEVYRLDFSGQTPTLLLNKAAGDKDTIARSPLFMSLVYPAAFREVLTRILHVEGGGDSDDNGDSWESRWLRFTESLPGMRKAPDKDDDASVDDWIDDAVSTFARQQNMLERFISGWQKGGA
jgi:hypothetical protein